MKRWLFIAALLGALVVGWSVPRDSAPGGCMGVLLYPDSVYIRTASCDGRVNDTLSWTAPSSHRKCLVQLRLDIDQRRLEVARADCEQFRPAADDRRVAESPFPGAP